MKSRLSLMLKWVMRGVCGAAELLENGSYSLMRMTVKAGFEVKECTCDGNPCICDDLEKMLELVNEQRVIDKGFMVSHENFEVGPGVAIQDGEELVDIYFWTNESDPVKRVGQQPALTIGFDKKATAKLIFMLLQAAKAHGWVEDSG